MEHVRGLVVRASDGVPVAGVTVTPCTKTGKPVKGSTSVITGRSGEFEVALLANGTGSRVRSVIVSDVRGEPLAPIVRPDQLGEVVIRLADSVLRKLPWAQPTPARTVLRASASELLDAITSTLGEQGLDEGGRRRAALEESKAMLPPLATHPTLFQLATEVLRGRSSAYELFAAELRELDDWNTSVFGANAPIDAEFAESVFAPRDPSEAHSHPPAEMSDDAIDDHALHTIVGAAIRISGGDAVEALRNVGVVARQLCPMRPVARLHEVASRIGSEGELTRFGAQLDRLDPGDWGPDTGWDDRPRPSRLPVPTQPGPRSGCPEGNPWPNPGQVSPRTPTLPMPGAPERCPDWLRQFRELERERTYSITSIEPQDACVGEQVVLRGTGLRFEDSTTSVTFAREGADSRVIARVVGTPTDTSITVEVPPGASCGPVELWSDDSTVEICGEIHELYRGPRRPAIFRGGLPHFRREVTVAGRSTSATGQVAKCIEVDGPVRITWGSCGVVEDVEVEVRREGTIVWTVQLQPSDDAALFPVPEQPAEAVYEATVRLIGRCGTAQSQVEFVTRQPIDPASGAAFVRERWVNFFRNHDRPLLVAEPASVAELRATVVAVEASSGSLGSTGSRCSYTECVAPAGTDHIIRMSGLKRWLNARTVEFPAVDASGNPTWAGDPAAHRPLAGYLLPPSEATMLFDGGVLRADIESVYSAEAWAAWAEVTNPVPMADRLVYVEAGMLVEELNALLDHRATPLALATMGAGSHQTLAGAISTGTHGSTWQLPPLADAVRAIHLIGTNGEQWWLEPESRPITVEAEMRQAARDRRFGLGPCARVRYADEEFFAALVAAGCAGIVYAYVLETVPAHYMQTRVQETTWPDAKARIRAVLPPVRPGAPPSPAPNLDWYIETIVLPSGDAVLVEKALVHPPVPGTPSPTSIVDAAVAAAEGAARSALETTEMVGLILGAIAAGAAAIALEVTEQTLVVGGLALLGPFAFWNRDYQDEVEAAAERLGMLLDLATALADALVLLGAWAADTIGITPDPDDCGPPATDFALASALPNLVELLWALSPFGVTVGQEALDAIQLQQSVDFKRVPAVAKSFTALTNQVPGPPSRCPRNEHYDPKQRIIRGSEFAFDVETGLRFVDELLEAAGTLRAGDDPFVLSVNVRFTRATSAWIGMQQFDPVSCHVEIFTMDGLSGTVLIEAEVERLVRRHGGRPHWGQFHPTDLDLPNLYTWKLQSWRRGIGRLADGRSTFRHAFATDRGLL